MINKQTIEVGLSNTKIEVSGPLEELTVTENGTYEPSDGTLGFNKVVVNTHIPVLKELEITENGTYEPDENTDGFNRVVVNTPIPVYEELNVETNGTYTPSAGIDGFNKVNVNIPIENRYQELVKEILKTDEKYILDDSGWIIDESINPITIKDYAYYRDCEIQEVHLHQVEVIGNYAFTHGQSGNSTYYNNISLIESDSVKEIGSYALAYADILENINMPNLEKIRNNCLYYLNKIESINLPSLKHIDTDNFTHMQLLNTVNLPELESIKGSSFSDLPKLTKLILPKLKSTDIYGYSTPTLAHGLTQLKELSVPLLEDAYKSLVIANGCQKLEKLDLGYIKNITSDSLYYCLKLNTLILRNTAVVSLASTSSLNTTPIKKSTTEGFIYVPDDLVDTYKTATNWVTFADKIKPISELPEEVQV